MRHDGCLLQAAVQPSSQRPSSGPLPEQTPEGALSPQLVPESTWLCTAPSTSPSFQYTVTCTKSATVV